MHECGIPQDPARCPKSFRRRALPGQGQNRRGAMKRCVPTGFRIGALRVAHVPARASPLLKDTCAIAARKCSAAYRGADSAENRIFRQNDKLQCGAFQRYPALAVAVDKSGKVQQITMVLRSNNSLFDPLARTPFARTGKKALRRPLCSGLSDGLFLHYGRRYETSVLTYRLFCAYRGLPCHPRSARRFSIFPADCFSFLAY